MNWLDLVLLLMLAVYAWTGWAHGFVANLFSAGGLLLGFALGVAVVPRLFDGSSGDITTALLSIALVFLCAGLGNVAGSMLGRRLRVERGPARALDAVAGALFGLTVVTVAAWAIGYALTASSLPHLAASVRESKVLATVDRFMPTQAGETLRAFTDTLTGDVFPRYLDPFETEIIPTVEPPDARVLARPNVRQARSSVVRVLGAASCQRSIEGSGFITGPERVMTNAHVVAGVARPNVTVGGRRYEARPVLFDRELDLAVLDVPGLRGNRLRFDTGAKKGDEVAILGYPENGPFDARAGRIRGKLNLRGPDIYGAGRAVREVLSVRGLVRSGNSGGPLISASGDVVGVVFAASVSDRDTGYAVAAAEAAPVARAGARATETVSTEGCS